MRRVLLAATIAFITAMPAPAKTGPAKTDWSQTLARALLKNSEGQYATLYEACEHSDFAALATALSIARSHVAPDKNEFWSDAEFAALRRQAEDTVNARGRLVVCQPLEDNDDAPFVYDANRETFAGEFIADQNVWREFKRTGGYAGQTAMGVRTKVTTALELEYNVSLKWEAPPAPESECHKYGLQPGCHIRYQGVSDPGCLQNAAGTYKYEVPAPRSGAEDLKAKGYLVFLGRLKYPFIVAVGLDGSPTITDTRDIYKRMLVVDLAPEEIAVVGPAGTQWTCKVDSH